MRGLPINVCPQQALHPRHIRDILGRDESTKHWLSNLVSSQFWPCRRARVERFQRRRQWHSKSSQVRIPVKASTLHSAICVRESSVEWIAEDVARKFNVSTTYVMLPLFVLLGSNTPGAMPGFCNGVTSQGAAHARPGAHRFAFHNPAAYLIALSFDPMPPAMQDAFGSGAVKLEVALHMAKRFDLPSPLLGVRLL